MIDDLLNYSDSKGQHILWNKRNVLSIRKRTFEYGEFAVTALAKRVVDLTSFLPKDTPLEYRVKAIMQGVNAYSKCIVCGNNATISKSLSFKDPFFTKFCSSKSCLMHHMSKSRKFTSMSRKKYSIAKHRYQEKLANESKKIVDEYCKGSYTLLSHQDVVDYAKERISSRSRNGSIVPSSDLFNKHDIICSIIFYTSFIELRKSKSTKMLSLLERIYCLAKEISHRPTCKFCGGQVKFFNINHGYFDSCADCQEEKRRITMGRPTYASVVSSIDKTLYDVIDAPNGRLSGKKKFLKIRCKRCGHTTSINLHCGAMFTRVMGKELCKYCGKYASNNEKEVRHAVARILGSTKDILVNDRTTISPYELDIVVPHLKTAIEFNGIYWHNERAVKRQYHQLKTMLCEKVGYRLVHIFEDRWNFNKRLCIGMLRRALNRIKIIDPFDCIVAIGSSTSRIEKFMKKYTFDFSHSKKNSMFVQFYYKSHLAACIEFYISKKKVIFKRIAQLNNFAIVNLVDRACSCMDRDIELNVPHDFYKAEDFASQGFVFKKYVPSTGRWLFYSKSKDIAKIKSNPSKHLKKYDSSKSFEDNLLANNFARVYDSGTIVLERHIANAFDDSH